MVIGQPLLQFKKKKAFSPWIFTFLLKKKKKIQFPVPSAVLSARLLIPLDRCVSIVAHTKPLRTPLQFKEKKLPPDSLFFFSFF